MRTKGKSPESKQEDLRAQLKELDEAIYSNSELIRKDGRVITRLQFPLHFLKKASVIRRKVMAFEAKQTKPKTRKTSPTASEIVSPPDFLTEQMLAIRWHCSRSRLQHWRSYGKGPEYLRIGGRILYRLADVQDFETTNRAK